jgi:transposase
LPAQHLVDAGYVRAQHLVEAREHHQVDVVGPIPADHQWQAKAKTGFDVSRFAVDWDAQVVICPRGCTSVRWTETHTARGRTMTRVEFAAADCTACPVRPQCTRARIPFRSLLLQPRAEHEMIQVARQRQRRAEYATAYAQRAWVEGTLSQGVRAFGLRRARYRGLAKTHLQHVVTAAAINMDRLINWLDEIPRAQTRRSRFAALEPAAMMGTNSPTVTLTCFDDGCQCGTQQSVPSAGAPELGPVLAPRRPVGAHLLRREACGGVER